MKKISSLILTLVLATGTAFSQLYIGTDANSLVIKTAEIFSYDGLTLTPSADFSLSNTTLTKVDANTLSPVTSGRYIKRYFTFSNTTVPYSGWILFPYEEGTMLTDQSNVAIAEADLRLNTFNGTSWLANSELPDQPGNFLQGQLSTRTLKHLTLAAATGPLPVTWLSFTATKKENTSVLNWSTATEQNTKDFVVQHSAGTGEWKSLGTVKAAGNATTRKDYTYTHHTPVPGYNYYRLIQRDQDGQFSYSKVVSVVMNSEDIKLRVFPNPVQDGRLNVLLKESTQVRLFDAAGRQVMTQRLNAGLQTMNVSGLQGGVYYLKAGAESVSVIIK